MPRTSWTAPTIRNAAEICAPIVILAVTPRYVQTRLSMLHRKLQPFAWDERTVSRYRLRSNTIGARARLFVVYCTQTPHQQSLLSDALTGYKKTYNVYSSTISSLSPSGRALLRPITKFAARTLLSNELSIFPNHAWKNTKNDNGVL